MSEAGRALDRIEAALTEIERLHKESGGKFWQASDREAFDIVCRIERQMMQNMGNGDGRKDGKIGTQSQPA